MTDPVASSEKQAEARSETASAAPSPRPPAFPPPPEKPTQQGPLGLLYDFNDGCRLFLPSGSWHVQLTDIDTGNILFDTDSDGGYVMSSKKYYVRFGIEVWKRGETSSLFQHKYDARGKNVRIQFPVGTLGDMMAWFPYAEVFQEQHQCRLTCALSETLIELFREGYPQLDLVGHKKEYETDCYATYNIGLFFDDTECVRQPCDFRLVGLHKTSAYILGVDPQARKPRIAIAAGRQIEEPYVCIAVQSTTQSKYWNNPNGWLETVRFLKRRGYRVLCIDQKKTHGQGLTWTHLPHGAEDFTGDHPLAERAALLKHADFFIGLSSGLSWLAWAAGTPVVMISGFTHPSNEFHTPYRVINYHTCNSCWNDQHHRFVHDDFFWCPRHKDTPRHYECTRLITAEQVFAVLRTIPGLRAEAAA
ncbi:autotransporter strand-loop-strand O-heptosyltransferase [Paludibacterium yongneupense]|uniref:autotransporter strand-loop-strand O-heptosyltransferase n=1 Tax=Paludibacterium yongneupense TaxID=400061 RepID=UPI000569C4ED|nr:autotransporter strand-loop-strand O-heptosyltransferase [Paludibacterium yongneupense]